MDSEDESVVRELGVNSTSNRIPQSRSDRVSWIKGRLSRGLWVPDEVFDGLIHPTARQFSTHHWTPVGVARIAVQLILSLQSAPRILDIGSGCGKAAMVMALSSGNVFVTGTEQRDFLFQSANRLKRLFNQENVHFLNENAFSHSWDRFSAFYFFNPFYEHRAEQIRIRSDIDFGEDIHERYVKESYHRLRSARVGSLVVTYWGYGGEMPPSYRLERVVPCGTDSLRCWRKVV